MLNQLKSFALGAGALGAVLAGVTIMTIGCSPETPKLAPFEEVKKEKVRELGSKVTFNPAVDILFVVDDSGSMSNHQKDLSTNIPLFINGIQSSRILDYHIGVITTSMESYYANGGGKLNGSPNFIDRLTPNGLSLLSKTLMPGTSGSSTEVFFDTVNAALTPPLVNGVNKGFYRPDAHLAIIFITDTEDQSAKLSADQYYQFLLGLKGGDPDKLLHYAAYVSASDNTCPRDDPQTGRIDRAIELMKGITFGLCDPDFGSKLAGLSVDLVDKVGKIVPLSRSADPATITVKYGTQIIPNDPNKGWTYDPVRSALVLGNDLQYLQQPTGTQLEVSFDAAQY